MDFPITIGASIDLLYAMRQSRYEAQKVVDDMKADEKKLETHVMKLLSDNDLNQGKGHTALASVSIEELPTVVNWDELYNYVQTTGEFDLLQRRISSTAIRERWNDGVQPPGVGKFTQASLSLRKV